MRIRSFSELANLQAGRFALLLGLSSVLTLAYIILFHLTKAYSLSVNAHDFGIQVGAARNAMLHGNFYCDVINMNYLGDHFSPSLILLSPVLFFSAHPVWVLVFQNLVMLLALWQSYRILRLFCGWKISLTAVAVLVPNLYFTEIFKHDFHIESLGFYLFLVLIYEQYHKEFRPWIFYPVLIVLAGIKEDVPLVLTFFFGIHYLRFRRRRDLFASIGLLLYFALTMKVFMPYFSDGVYTHMHRYQSLGNSPSEVFRNFFTDPVRFLTVIKWDSLNTFFKSFYYLPLLALPEFLPALIPLYYNNASDYFVQSNLWWIHSYMILPLVILATASSLSMIWRLLSGSFFEVNKEVLARWKSAFQNLLAQLKNWLAIIHVKQDTGSLWFLPPLVLVRRHFRLFMVWMVFLAFVTFSLAGRYRSIVVDSYPNAERVKSLNQNGPVLQALEKEIKQRIPLSSRIASCGELQPHLLDYAYSGFMGLPQWDSLTFVQADYLIFLEDRCPWPFSDESSYVKYKEDRLPVFEPYYKDQYFLVLRKKHASARP